jgi:hypothetical protein
MNTSVAVGGTVYGWVSTDLDTANKYSIPLITYEGGQGLSYFAGRFSVEMSAQFDPGMFKFTITISPCARLSMPQLFRISTLALLAFTVTEVIGPRSSISMMWFAKVGWDHK